MFDSIDLVEMNLHKRGGSALARVGVIGTGRMGNAFALNLLKASHDVYVYDVAPAATQNLIRHGANVVKSPNDIAALVDFLIISLPKSEIVEDVIIGREGVKNDLRAESIVIDMSTTHPRVTKMIANELIKSGIDFLDSPVSGHVAGATNATLTIMVGGKKEAFLKCKEPIFEKLGKNIFYAGPSGAGQALKLVNNLLYNLNRLAVCEGLILGAKAGIDLDILRQAVLVSTGASFPMKSSTPDIFLGDFAGRESSLNLACKTLKLITDFADELQAPLLLGTLAKQIYNIVRLQGDGENSPASVITFYESIAKIEARTTKK
jgi:3-hydroxyisobutyrate dehydrogenase-like beta-hydroxyacid dehydrogenase